MLFRSTGTSPDLTSPPISADAPAQASAKSALPTLPAATEAAKALASRRESTSIAAGKTETVEDEKKLKEFVEDDRHFSLVRCVTLSLLLSTSTRRRRGLFLDSRAHERRGLLTLGVGPPGTSA